MSNLHSLRKPKTQHKKHLYILIAVLMIVVVIAGIVSLTKKGKYKIPAPVVTTEVVETDQ